VDLFEEIALKAQRQRAQASHIVAAGERPCAFPTPWGFAVIHRATYGDSAWRCTWLNKSREPTGHCDAVTFAAAIDDARRDGADLFSEVSP
jgi:hypothetical protein